VTSEIETYLLLCAMLSTDEARWNDSACALADADARAALVAFAQKERVLPALHEAVSAHWAKHFSRAERIVLATRHEENRRQNRNLRDALIEIGANAGERGFDVTVLKGAAWILGDARGLAAWRTMIDADVLVAQEHFEAMPELLLKLGYAPVHQRRLIGRRKNHDHFHLVPYTNRARAVTVEVHRTIGFRPDLLPNSIAFSGPSIQHAGLRLPPPWYAALHAMIHWQVQNDAYRRRGSGIREIIETARHLQRSDVDWNSLAEHARRCGVLRECSAAVAFAQQLLGERAPSVLQASEESRSHVRRSLLVQQSPSRARILREKARNTRLWRGDRTLYKLSRRGIGQRKAAFVIGLYRASLMPLISARWVALSAAEAAIALYGRVRERRDASPDIQSPSRCPH
jgi:Uncharacterised nucleotidyltransferase